MKTQINCYTTHDDLRIFKDQLESGSADFVAFKDYDERCVKITITIESLELIEGESA